MIIRPTLTVQQTVAVHRNRFPQALVCIVCAVLLATAAASYAASNLTEPQRLAYVCAECRQDAADGAKAQASRTANLTAARAALAHTRVALRGAKSEPDIPSTSNTVLRYSATSVRTAGLAGLGARGPKPPAGARRRVTGAGPPCAEEGHGGRRERRQFC
jgi:hypothetical protein